MAVLYEAIISGRRKRTVVNNRDSREWDFSFFLFFFCQPIKYQFRQCRCNVPESCDSSPFNTSPEGYLSVCVCVCVCVVCTVCVWNLNGVISSKHKTPLHLALLSLKSGEMRSCDLVLLIKDAVSPNLCSGAHLQRSNDGQAGSVTLRKVSTLSTWREVATLWAFRSAVFTSLGPRQSL